MHADDVVIRTVLYTLTSSLHALLLGAMTWRKLYREYPVFFTYMAVMTACNVIGYWTGYFRDIHRATYMTYFVVYWAGDIIVVALSLVVVYRIFNEVFGRYEMLRRTGPLLYAIGTVGLLAFAVVTAAMAPGRNAVRVTAAIVLFERSVALIRCGLLLLVFAAAAFMALSWRSQVFGIALGLGVWSSIELLHLALQANFGTLSGWLLKWAPLTGYALAVTIWFVYLGLRSAPEARAEQLPDTEVTQWNETLADIVHRC